VTLGAHARDYRHGPAPHRLTFEESYWFRQAAENFAALPVDIERDPENDRPPFTTYSRAAGGPRPMTPRDRLWNWWGMPVVRHPASVKAIAVARPRGRKLHYGLALPDGYCLQRSELWAARWRENVRDRCCDCGRWFEDDDARAVRCMPCSRAIARVIVDFALREVLGGSSGVTS
jgi:hypothetical protein